LVPKASRSNSGGNASAEQKRQTAYCSAIIYDKLKFNLVNKTSKRFRVSSSIFEFRQL